MYRKIKEFKNKTFKASLILLILASINCSDDSCVDRNDSDGEDSTSSDGGNTSSNTSSTGFVGVGGNGGSGGVVYDSPPIVVETSPVNHATNISLNTNVSATFSEDMNPETITPVSFRLFQGEGEFFSPVLGVVSYSGTVASLDPDVNLAPNTKFVAVVSKSATDLNGNHLLFDKWWKFETGSTVAKGPAPVNLGTAGDFVILSKSGIDTIPISILVENIGVSPIDSTALTGFSLTMDSSNVFSTSAQLTGKAYAADYTPPTPSNLTTAVSNMEAAFTDAAGRPIPDFTELASGNISGLTLVPGLYKWGTGLLITTDVTLDGGPNDVWIFQISGGITQESGSQILLSGGALPKNIFWQAYGAVALDTTAHLEGVVLSQTEITLATGSSVNGRLLSQTAVTLDGSTVVEPAE